ncbi:ankyrin repeat-containing domain protein [Podospora didyma]|uniref:Ankyrin repeat-containing domain protein n=1 Tax=Podospora didyma TaxID=330526 RepID=A0AAE0U521_9PEZI|nr:ankyrin repeat-containing domain protein [Podospora didyma]
MKRPYINIIGERDAGDIFLAALQLGNHETATNIMLKSKRLGSLPDGTIAKAVLIACEFRDEPIASAILADAELSQKLMDDLGDDSFAPAWNPIHVAAATGQASLVKKLLDLPVEVNLVTPEHRTALMIAAMHGFSRLAILLVENSAFVDCCDDAGMTPLHFASLCGSKSIVQLLMANDADVVAQTYSHDMPLQLAICNGHLEAAQSIIEKIAAEGEEDDMEIDSDDDEDVNDSGESLKESDDDPTPFPRQKALGYALCEIAKQDVVDIATTLVKEAKANVGVAGKSGMTPLHFAARNGSLDLVQLLVESGASISLKAKNYRTPLELACSYGKLNVVKELLRAADASPSTDGKHDLEALKAVCSSGETALLRALLSRYDADGLGQGLISASVNSQTSTAEVLLDSGCNLEAVDAYKNTALHFAAYTDTPVMVQLLILRGSVLDCKDDSGSTPMSDAARVGSHDSMKLLINAGADTEAKNTTGETALSRAIYWEKPETVRLLLERGAEMRLPDYWKDREGGDIQTILEFTLRRSSQETARAVIRAYGGGKGEEEVTPGKALSLVLKYEPAVLSSLLDSWPEAVDSLSQLTNAESGTILHTLVAEGNIEQLKFVLPRIDVPSFKAVDVAGRLPIHLSAHYGNAALMELLLGGDVSLETPDCQGRNALHYAVVSRRWSISKDVMRLYREKNPNATKETIDSFVNAPDADGWTPLHWACRQTDPDVVEFIIGQGGNNLAKTKSNWTPWHVATFHDLTSMRFMKFLSEPIESEKASGLLAEEIQRHNASCDICYCTIHGRRHQCQSDACRDFDMCFKCYGNHSRGIELHPRGHEFEVLNG